MSQILQYFILLPLAAFVISLLLPAKKEKYISWLVIATTTLHLTGALAFIIYWLINGSPVLDIKQIIFYKSPDFEFWVDFYFDKTTAVYSFVGSSIILLVSIFSRYYLHRDHGFKRFFNTLLLFFLGYNLVIFSGNFETLFIGWEILGFCSFLLIAFYRDRYLPVKNGLKVLSVYRLGDVCLMLAMWMSHHVFHRNITFAEIAEPGFISSLIPIEGSFLIFIVLMFVIAAAIKSALLPFSSWLPRAMEGPTTSSAVFYGSLSVHIGPFLLIRTAHMWEDILSVKILILVLGLTTALVAASIARVQSTVKTQIAYSSITQIGLIFIEVALGLHWLALIHFAGNAFLRTYQLLVSPSVLNYEIHDMIFNFKPRRNKTGNGFIDQLKNAVYILGIKEWNIDSFMYHVLWMPFKWIGRAMKFLVNPVALVILALVFLVGVSIFSFDDLIPANYNSTLLYVFAALSVLLILRAFAERGHAARAWLLVISGQCFITMAIALNEVVPLHQVMIYMAGIIMPGIVGYICLKMIYGMDKNIDLDQFHGYSYEQPKLSFVFLLCSLAMIGFPITPTFLGIDLLFTHIHEDQVALIILTTIAFIFIELAIIRIYCRVFLGQHKKNYHPIAYRSS